MIKIVDLCWINLSKSIQPPWWRDDDVLNRLVGKTEGIKVLI